MATVNEVIEDIGWGRFHFLQLLLLGGLRMTDLSEVIISSSIMPSLKTKWGISSAFKGCLVSIIFVGVFLGGLSGGYLADWQGRRKGVILSYFGVIICGLSLTFSPGPYAMLISRFFFGCFYGLGVGALVTLMVESAPIHSRATMINLSDVSGQLGLILGACLLWTFTPELNVTETFHGFEKWRLITFLAISPALVIFSFALMLLEESPYFLVVQGRNEEALSVLKVMASWNGAERAVCALQPSDVAIDLHSTRDPTENSRLLPDGGHGPGTSRPACRESYWSDLYQLIWGQTGILLGATSLCFLANWYTFGQNYALTQIFRRVHSSLSPSMEVLILSVCQLPGEGIALVLANSQHVGHRDALVALALMMGLLTLFIPGLENQSPDSPGFMLALCAAYLASCLAVCFFNLSYIYISEVFPSSVRGTAVAFCIAAGRLGPVLCPLLFELTADKSNNHTVFWGICSFLCFLCIVIIRSCLIFEMKGEALEHLVQDNKVRGARRPSISLPTATA